MHGMEVLRGINHRGFDNLPVLERITRWGEYANLIALSQLEMANSRHCADCGVPFCHKPVLDNRSGCPVENSIPDFNLAVSRGHWRLAYNILSGTNNFPEFTGRLCPAPCEAACTRNIDNNPVNIEMIERAIIEKAFSEGWVQAVAPSHYTGNTVAVIGSGPSGLACAQELARRGHTVTVYEKSPEPGGLLMYGIPNFKMEKWVVERRIHQMEAEGIQFRCGVDVGVNLPVDNLLNGYDAVVLAGGAQMPRDLAALGSDPKVDGRDLKGIHYAMELLGQDNWRNSNQPINAQGKHVVVIGGGDTGSDCIGTSIRQGATSIVQLEILPQPSDVRTNSWPMWPNHFTTSSSQEEGLELGILKRLWVANVQSFQGRGQVEALQYVDVDWSKGRPMAAEGPEKTLKADLVLIAAGFLGAKKEGLLTKLGVPFDPRGNVLAYDYQVPHETGKIFSAGDMRRGQSLIVWAIREGRDAAHTVDEYLMGRVPKLKAVPQEAIERMAQYPQWAQKFTAERFALAA